MENKKKFTFVSYDGKWPNLCSGVLKLKDENGDTYRFGPDYYSNPENRYYPRFWHSGGCIYSNDDLSDIWATKGLWEFDDFTKNEFLFENQKQLIDIFNENVEMGCCGGCI